MTDYKSGFKTPERKARKAETEYSTVSREIDSSMDYSESKQISRTEEKSKIDLSRPFNSFSRGESPSRRDNSTASSKKRLKIFS
jgi:hypothetical protein